jgi:phage host-nuclease inhibitor protein Gam
MEEADRVVSQIREVDKEIAANDNKQKELKDDLRKARARDKRLRNKRERLQALVQAFADPRRSELLKEGDPSKSFIFPSGGKGLWYFRSRPKLIVTGKVDAIVRSIKRKRPDDWNDFVRIREELIADALKAHPDFVKGLRGVRIEDGELFRVDP